MSLISLQTVAFKFSLKSTHVIPTKWECCSTVVWPSLLAREHVAEIAANCTISLYCRQPSIPDKTSQGPFVAPCRACLQLPLAIGIDMPHCYVPPPPPQTNISGGAGGAPLIYVYHLAICCASLRRGTQRHTCWYLSRGASNLYATAMQRWL